MKTGEEVILSISGLRIEAWGAGGWKSVVKGIDLDVMRGQMIGLIGESGAGKTTIGLSALGYMRPGFRFAAGTVKFDGLDLVRASEEAKRRLRGTRIAYVAQNAATAFNPAHRIIEQFIEVPEQHGQANRADAIARAKELYREMRLPDAETIGYRFPHQVSGGQLQRAMVAMAMSCRPDLIVFDEPTSALDVTTQLEVLRAIRSATRHFGTAGLYISHDIAAVSQMADRIVVLQNGELVEQGPTRRLIDHPQESYTRDLISARSRNTAALSSRSGQSGQREDVVLSVDKLSVGYGGVLAAEAINLRVPRGRTVAVIGESGSGKTTLARAIAGLVTPQAGHIRFKGEPLPLHLRQRSREQLSKLQFIGQSPDASLNPRQTIRTAIGRPIRMFSGLSGDALEEKIKSLLKMVELDPEQFISRYPGQLSGGQRQRVCIARALATDPELIICDEVTSALDPLIAEDIFSLIRSLQERFDLSCLFITHDFSAVEKVSHEVIVMSNGNIVESGYTIDVLNNPSS